MSYLDSLPEFNNKAILVQSTLGYQMAMAYLGYRDVGLENLESGSYLLGDFEDNNGPFNNVQLASPNESLFDSLSDEITWYNQLLGVANDTNQSEDTRLKCLTELVDQARLNEVPLLPYNPVITPQTNIPPSALVIHNETTGVEGVGFLHIGPVELALIYSARQSFDSFAQITGVYTDNASLVGGFATKEDLITPSGDAAQFWNGNKTFSAISFSQLASTPTTLAGYGISASDNLFDNKYLQLGSQLQTLNTTSGTPLTTTTTVIEGFGRLQNQVSARELSLGNPAVNGYVLSSTTAGVRSWIPAPTGTAVTGISLTGTNGITGAVVITAGNAVITAGTNITGMLKGNGTAISAATEMTDYIGITGATNGDTILFTGGVATWAPGLSNPMTLLGDLIIGGASGATTRLAGNTTTTRKFLMSVGASGAALAQTYATLLAGDIPNIAISQVTNLQATLDQRLSDNLLSGRIFIGNTSDLATGVVPSGDWTITTAGVATIEQNAVTFDKFQQATGPQILVGTPDILGVQDFIQITLDPATLQIDASGVMSSIATGTGTVTNTNTLTLNSLVLGDGGTAVKVGGGFTTDGVSQLTLGVIGTSVGGLLLTNITSGTIELRPVTGALGTTVLTLFAGSDTLVGLAATQTLTNKTLTNPQINGALLQTSSTVGYVWTATNTTGAGSWQAPTGGGSGTVTSASQYSIPYYSVNPSGTTVIGLAPQTTNGVYFLRANVTASAAVAPSWIGSTGSGNVVLATSPTLVTPTLGVALATSINGLTITSSTGTLTIANGSTLATSGAFSTTLTATATTTLTLPTTGTLATLAGTETFTNKTLNGPKIGTAAGSGHFHMHLANSAPTGITDYITVFGDTSPTKKLGFLFETDVFESYFQFDTTATSKTYTFPDATGTVALINASNYLSVPKNGAVSGGIIFEGGTSGTISLEAPLIAGTQSYIFPSAYPAAASGYYLTSNLSGTLSWVAIAAGGDVTGPASSVDGNFAVFDSTTGKIIKESAGASLSAAGAAVFNTSLALGVGGTTTGQLIFRNATTSATTTLLASTSQTANLIYTWPISTPTLGQILSSDASGNLSWTAAGAGNVIAAGTNTFTGTNTFNAGTIRINNAANNGYHILASLAGPSGTLTASFPAATGTVPLLSLAQTFSALQSFSAGLTVSGGVTTFSHPPTTSTPISVSGAGSTANPHVRIEGTTLSWMSFGTTGVAAPTLINSPSRSVGTKVVILQGTGATLDSAIGVESTGMWLSSSQAIRFYTNASTTVRAIIDSAGLTLSQAGSGVLIKEGTNATMGVATLVGGTVTVSTTKVTANSRIFLSVQTAGGTQGLLRISARTAATSFTITSFSALDTSTVAWVILEPAP